LASDRNDWGGGGGKGERGKGSKKEGCGQYKAKRREILSDEEKARHPTQGGFPGKKGKSKRVVRVFPSKGMGSKILEKITNKEKAATRGKVLPGRKVQRGRSQQPGEEEKNPGWSTTLTTSRNLKRGGRNPMGTEQKRQKIGGKKNCRKTGF